MLMVVVVAMTALSLEQVAGASEENMEVVCNLVNTGFGWDRSEEILLHSS